MNPIRVVSVSGASGPLLETVAAALAREFRTTARVDTTPFDAAFAHHPERNQYHSTAIIRRLEELGNRDEVRIGITGLDLYIPILTFVFGEAHLDGHCAVVSYHRLSQEFYGLPSDPDLLVERLVKEAIHEVGHTLALTHCDDFDCVMAASHAVEWLDQKGHNLCSSCRAKAGLSTLAAALR